MLERQDIGRLLLNHEYVDLHYDCLGGLAERYIYVETGAYQSSQLSIDLTPGNQGNSMMQGQGDKLKLKLVTCIVIEKREKIRKDVDEEILKFLRAKNKYHEPVDMICC